VEKVQWLQQQYGADTHTQMAHIWDLDVLNYGTVRDCFCFWVVKGQACSLSVSTLHAHVDVGVASIMISPGRRLMTAGFLDTIVWLCDVQTGSTASWGTKRPSHSHQTGRGS
jgi:hypothetical protein